MARGFFAELQHQARIAERNRIQAQKVAERHHKAAVRRAEQARKADERTAKALERANDAERKRLEKEARQNHIDAMEAEVEQLNLALQNKYEEIQSLLAATLELDDFVDLETLRISPSHPPFAREDLKIATPPTDLISPPPKPALQLPVRPKGIKGLLGGKKHERAVKDATIKHRKEVKSWQDAVDRIPALMQEAEDEHASLEAERLKNLNAELARYEAECEKRESEARSHNQAVDELIANLGYGTVDAVQEYVSIVLSNSTYPSHFPVDHEFSFDPETAELKLRVLIPGPQKMPSIKSYKYTKSSDEITSSPLSNKASKDLYADAINQIAFRSLHEVFEADRRGLVRTITLEVGTETISPATGQETYVPFVATGAARESFLKINLSDVVPAATLDHLGAAVSKNPFGLVAAKVKGIRNS